MSMCQKYFQRLYQRWSIYEHKTLKGIEIQLVVSLNYHHSKKKIEWNGVEKIKQNQYLHKMALFKVLKPA